MEDHRRSVFFLAALATALTIAALSAPSASAAKCGNVGGGFDVQAFQGVDCNNAAQVVQTYNADPCPPWPAGEQCVKRFTVAGRPWRAAYQNFSEGEIVSANADDENGDGNVTWHVRNTGGGGGGGGAATLSSLLITPALFKAKSSGGPVTTSGGAQVSYRLSSATKVTLSVVQTIYGRKIGPGASGCVRQTPANRTRPRCVRTIVTKGFFTHNGKAGGNSFRFSGRVGGRKLAPGAYSLRAAPQGVQRFSSRTFSIARP